MPFLCLTHIITYGELFGYPGLSLKAVIIYQATDANISFFDSNLITVGLGLGYEF